MAVGAAVIYVKMNSGVVSCGGNQYGNDSPLREGSAKDYGRTGRISMVVSNPSPRSIVIHSSRSRSPLREGSAMLYKSISTSTRRSRSNPRMVMQSSKDEGSSKGCTGAVACSSTDRGVDTLQVRRANAPTHRARVTGNFTKALLAVATSRAKEVALTKLREDVYANSSKDPRRRKLCTLNRICAAASPSFDLIPLTCETLAVLAAAFKAGGYRTGGAYLLIAKKQHILAGHTWTPALTISLKDATRSIVRGIGPPEHAVDFRLENLADSDRVESSDVAGSPILPVQVGLCMALWMLRGIEAAALLGEQVTIASDESAALLDLGPTKEDVCGRGCRRTLLCACDNEAETLAVDICPVHAMIEIMKEREKLNLTGKHALFPQRNGTASTDRGVCGVFSKMLNLHITEHSFRRAGAQYYARNGVAVGIIQFIGRWGSETVYRYIDEALDAQAMHAARTAAGANSGPSCTLEVTKKMGPVVKLMDKLSEAENSGVVAEEIVRQAIEAAQKVANESCYALELKLCAAAEQNLGAVRASGKAAARGHTHRIAIGDACFPTGLWTTACGWRFGAVPHMRVDIGMITCGSCAKFMDCTPWGPSDERAQIAVKNCMGSQEGGAIALTQEVE